MKICKILILIITGILMFAFAGCKIYYTNVESIKIVQAPIKVKYLQGEDLILTGLQVQKIFEGGLSDEIKIDKLIIAGYDANKTGKQTIVVKYTEMNKDYYTTFEIEVLSKLKKIEVAVYPRRNYFKGENFTKDGTVVIATFEDGTTETVTDWTIDYPNMDILGTKKVTLSLKRNDIVVSTSFEITLLDLNRIEVTVAPFKLNYIAGEKFDRTGMQVRAIGVGVLNPIYVDITNCVIVNPSIEQALTEGTQAIIISFLDKMTQFNITVTAK